MAETGVLEVVCITKLQLQRALERSGLSYEQPPEQDAQRVWEALNTQIIHVTIEDPHD